MKNCSQICVKVLKFRTSHQTDNEGHGAKKTGHSYTKKRMLYALHRLDSRSVENTESYDTIKNANLSFLYSYCETLYSWSSNCQCCLHVVLEFWILILTDSACESVITFTRHCQELSSLFLLGSHSKFLGTNSYFPMIELNHTMAVKWVMMTISLKHVTH